MREDDPHGRLGELLRYGTVAAVDRPRGRVTVRIGDIEATDLRWLTGAAGDTRLWSPPTVGEQILVIAPEGDIAGAIALRGVLCDVFPAIGDETRDLVEFGDGAVIAYDPAGHALEAVLPAGATVRIVAPGGVRIEADVEIVGAVRIDGDVEVLGRLTASDDVEAAGISLKDHTHPGVQRGGAITDPPQ